MTRARDNSNILGTASANTGGVLTSDSSQTNGYAFENTAQYAAGKNKIINGDMAIDQRANGTAKTISTTGSYVSCDRWQSVVPTSVVATMQQVTDAPTGFGYSAKYTISTGQAITSSVTGSMWQWIEGYNTQNLAWGTSSAKTITLSFWAKSSLTGNHCVTINAGTSIWSYCTTYNITAANTWQYFSIIVPGLTSSAANISNGNAASIAVTFSLAAGSTYQTTANTCVVIHQFCHSAASP